MILTFPTGYKLTVQAQPNRPYIYLTDLADGTQQNSLDFWDSDYHYTVYAGTYYADAKLVSFVEALSWSLRWGANDESITEPEMSQHGLGPQWDAKALRAWMQKAYQQLLEEAHA